MKREKFQIDTTARIRELSKEVARQRGKKLGPFVHQLLAQQDPELARLIREDLGIEASQPPLPY